ncbi:hypothetical protein LTR04_002815 [Oleoguttula sp. CCFEE 6159]|nr:hypothetical protein LTR04_002815 [Oleoguttula sp. CCFEE 6159]
MNGVLPAALWQEVRNADGRVYYYNTETKATTWTKPEALMTAAERALVGQPWKEYVAEGGRKYWYNTETKQSSWAMPEVYKNALAQDQPPQRPAAPAFVAGGSSNFSTYPSQRDQRDQRFDQRDQRDQRDRFDDSLPERLGSDRQLGYSAPDVRPSFTMNADPEYSTFEEAEAAFFKLLKRSGVQPDWSWEQTMRATIKDPQYRALKDPRERKAAFEKYAVDVRLQEKDKAKERLAKLKSDFGIMLRRHPEIKHYTRWKTARPIIEGEVIFRSTSDDNERRQLFEEYIAELKRVNIETEVHTRKAAMDDLIAILKALDLEPYTRWSDAQSIIQGNERFAGDKKFEMLSKSDILTAFENHIKSLERTFNDAKQKEKNSKARRERQNRDSFMGLLRDLRGAGKIRAGTKWMDVHPLIEDDPRYIAMLGQAGSTPLDLFWDMVEEEERALRGKRNEVLDVLDDKRYEIHPNTTVEEFLSVMRADNRTSSIPTADLELIFARLHEKVVKRSEEDRYAEERRQRRATDALRSRIKHLEPPVLLGDTWEKIRPRVEKSDEYRAVDSDELRQGAFDKVIKRLKEKEEDVERERERRGRDRRDRERDRERDPPRNSNSYSDTHGRRDRRHRTRSPEIDAYEADRRKAIADRERQYRKASITGLTPPPRDRRDRDRERDRDDRGRLERYDSRDGRDRRDRQVSLSIYDRERREREAERERTYVSRADPREKGRELDYGDSGSDAELPKTNTNGTGSLRRRRDSELSAESRRDNKVGQIISSHSSKEV